MKTIREALESLGYTTSNSETYDHLEEWKDWYEGYVKEFHSYNVYNGVTTTKQERERLNMAKTICEDWAGLILNEKVEITAGEQLKNDLDHVFEYNDFRTKANQLIELAFAFGTGAFVEYLDENKEVVIDYIRADMIYPISWENGYINECAFGSVKEGKNGKQIYLQIHRLDDNAKLYVIENHMLDGETGEELELSENMVDEVITGSDKPLFQIISPNIINNIDLDSPLGISVFGNAISQIKGCDLVYDSYMNEFKLGRRRILVPLSMAKVQMSEQGTGKPVFDPNDTMFYAVPDDRNNQQKIEPMDMSIRAEEHEKGINRALDMLSFKCGMGTGRYKFENGSVKTATEVISSKSDLYRTLCKHEIPIGRALKSLVDRIAFLLGKSIPNKIDIKFDDSIIQDEDSERLRDRQDVAMGVMRLVEYRAKWYGETEEEAAKKLPQQADTLDGDI
ncbi:phage portal protein [Anaerosporobacter faecicola]|uniref:phage portal protein n=1 Tax=Anaerosporobacter faecicola TaxID=2718714 RepID=UPI001439C0F5|nr:phage portal protein [Anaerosporobacter faecicola]